MLLLWLHKSLINIFFCANLTAWIHNFNDADNAYCYFVSYSEY